MWLKCELFPLVWLVAGSLMLGDCKCSPGGSRLQMNLGRIDAVCKSGAGPQHANGAPLAVSLKQFWQWSGLDLISSSQRSIPADFLVAHALGVDHGP